MATWSAKYISTLPDSSFACVNSSGRHYPYKDASGAVDLPHLRAALSRIADPNNEQCGKSVLQAAAKREGVGQNAKALMPVSAKALDPDEEKAWFAGKIGRRLLAIPFGGPIPSPKSKYGVDLDHEWFSERTDIFGGEPWLLKNRERLVDWHHSAKPPGPGYGDPSGMMSGHFLGKSILDPNPEEDGWWVDQWFEAGNRRVALIQKLAEKGATLYGSSQPFGKTDRTKDGEITLWPFWLETLSTSPQNTYSVLRPKAVLDELASFGPTEYWDDLGTSLRDLSSDLRLTSDDLRAMDGVKAGRVLSGLNESDLRTALEQIQAALDRMQTVVGRQTQVGEPDG